MLDIQYIRDNKETVIAAAKNKGVVVDFDELLKIDGDRRQQITNIEQIRQARNELSAHLKSQKPSQEQIEEGKKLRTELNELESTLTETDQKFNTLLKQVPNIATDDTPVGASEDENQVVYQWGDKPTFEFEAKNHWELAEKNGWIDKERAAKVAGARFAYIEGPLVLLQFAIQNYVAQRLSDASVIEGLIKEAELDLPSKPFTPVLPPHMIKTEVFDAMDRLEPQDDRYKIEGEELWLQGSAEHVLGSKHMDEIIDEADLPLRYLGFATSFRKEAGTYGKDMEGIIRMHQFDKLEMEIISTPETGLDEHMLTIAIQEDLLKQLEIPYQKLLKCTADIGKPNMRGVDLEAWLPGQGRYRETHTADFMGDYQARRLKTKVRRADGTIDLVHTIDATAFALGRLMVAIIENYQNVDGTVRVPEVLKSFIGKEVI